MTEATDSSLNSLAIFSILVPVIVIALLVIIIKKVGDRNDRKR
jgi:uncharacterized membrane protein